MGQQASDGLNDVADVLAAAEVAGESPPVLQVSDAVLDPDTPRGMRLSLSLVHFLVPVGRVLLELAMRRCHHPSAGLRAQALIAGIGENLHGRSVSQEPDQP